MAGLLSLHVLSGVKEGTLLEFPSNRKKVTVGRKKGNALYIKDETVSQKHALLENKDGQWFITDCASSNGTSVNGLCLDSGATVELRNGDLIKVGTDNEVRVKISGAPEEVEIVNSSHLQELGVENEEMKGSQKSDSQVLTLKKWFEQEKVRQSAACAAAAEAAIKELAEHTKLLKMEICEASGVDLSLISGLEGIHHGIDCTSVLPQELEFSAHMSPLQS